MLYQTLTLRGFLTYKDICDIISYNIRGERMKKFFKYSLKFIQLVMIFSLLFIVENKTSTNLSKIENSNLNKSLDLNALQTMNDNIKEIQKSEENEKVQNDTPLSTVTGNLTGYAYNCATCSKRLACKSSLDLSNGNVYYNDNTYGNIRIVAASQKYSCGTVVRFKKSSISSEPITAIVLDRGVSGNTLDLLVQNENIARSTIGRSKISYEILRNGWQSE